jgi:hypothetical protein
VYEPFRQPLLTHLGQRSQGIARFLGFFKDWRRGSPQNYEKYLNNPSHHEFFPHTIPRRCCACRTFGRTGHSVRSRYVHSADAVLLAAADAAVDRTVELMGEAKPEAEVVLLRARQ